MQWSPALGELARPEYDSAETIPFLTTFLGHPDIDVRLTVSEILFKLGSKAPAATLRQIIADGADGKIADGTKVEGAANILHRYRQRIDPDTLFAAYNRLQIRGMIETLLLQEVPQIEQLARAGLKNPPDGGGTQGLAAALGLNDPEAIRGYEELLGYWPSFRLIGNLGLFRATGDPTRLQYIIDTAKEGLGLLPETGKVGDTTTQESMQMLAITVNPAATQALREIAEYTASRNFDVSKFGLAFGALFYVHRDYGFVDQLALKYFRNQISDAGIDRSYLFQIAAARNTPELREAAEACNAESFYRYFVLNEGRPIEGWIGEYVSKVPIHLRVASDD